MTDHKNQDPQSSAPRLSELRLTIGQLSQSIGAKQILITDYSGNVLLQTPEQNEREAVLLGAVAAGNLAAMDELLRLSGSRTHLDDPKTLVVEGVDGSVVLCRGRQGLVFIAALEATAMIGLARIEIRRLAQITWDLDNQATSDSGGLAVDLARQFLDSLDTEL